MNGNLIMIIVAGALINNVVLNQFLGICSFLGVSKQMKASVSLGGAVIFVITIASAVASLLYAFWQRPDAPRIPKQRCPENNRGSVPAPQNPVC